MLVIRESNQRISTKNLVEVLKDHFGTESKDKIKQMMIRSKMARKTGRFSIHIANEKKTIPKDLIDMLKSCGVFVNEELDIDIDRVEKLLSKDNFEKLSK